MHAFYRSALRPHLARCCLGTAWLLLAMAAPAQAQAPAAPPKAAAAATAPQADPAATRPRSRPDQSIERIRNEDAGARIDELRVGGETQSITVQPKNDMPAYEIKPADARGAAGNASMGNRVWNFLKF